MLPDPQEYPAYYEPYVALVQGSDLVVAMQHAGKETSAFLDSIGEERGGHRYAPGKWSIRQVIQHIVDTERIFAYRALRFARQDGTALPGFDEEHYAEHGHADDRTLASLVEEFRRVRDASVSLFEGLHPSSLSRMGTCNANRMSVRAIGCLIIGHSLHHAGIIRERYC